jgi:hypothetical protein
MIFLGRLVDLIMEQSIPVPIFARCLLAKYLRFLHVRSKNLSDILFNVLDVEAVESQMLRVGADYRFC